MDLYIVYYCVLWVSNYQTLRTTDVKYLRTKSLPLLLFPDYDTFWIGLRTPLSKILVERVNNLDPNIG